MCVSGVGNHINLLIFLDFLLKGENYEEGSERKNP